MNTQRLIALSMIALSAASTAAFAGEIVPVRDSFTPTVTRAAVRAEVQQGHAAGIVNFAGGEGDAAAPAPVAQSVLSREEVRAQARRVPRNAVAGDAIAGA